MTRTPSRRRKTTSIAVATACSLALVAGNAHLAAADPDPLGNRPKPTFQRNRPERSAPERKPGDPGLGVRTSVRASTDEAPPVAAEPASGAGSGARPAAGIDDGSYTLGPRDLIEVELWNKSVVEFGARQCTVTERGTIFLPLLRDVEVGGLTVSQATERLTALYDQYIIDPQVFVLIREYNSRQVSVVGEVKAAGRYALKGDAKLSEVLALAGDLTRDASQMVRVIREDENGKAKEVFDIDLAEINAGNPEHNIRILPNDSIYVLANKNIVYLSGMVRVEGYVDWEEGMTAQQAVILAGGLAEGNAAGRTKLYREVDGTMTETKINLKDKKRQTPILPGDIIHVPRSWI